MPSQEFSATRSRTSWKPRIDEGDLPIFSCPECGAVYTGLTTGAQPSAEGMGKTKLVTLPYKDMVAPPCGHCGAQTQQVDFVPVEDLPEGIELDFQFRGGFNANCVKVKWHIKPGFSYAVEWVTLKTFTGTQTKYVTPGKYSPITFAFADEDAYCYCDSDPCEECMFRCKFGMVAYVKVSGIGVVRMGFDRMLASGAGSSNAGLRRSSN